MAHRHRLHRPQRPQLPALSRAAGRRRRGAPADATWASRSRAEDEDFEYAGTPRGVFCQRANLARPAFWRMLADLLRFNRALRAIARRPAPARSARSRSSSTTAATRAWFIERLIVPQASAVWSADPAAMWSFPVRFLAEFFANHGMLGFRDRPRWQTVVGGSHRYVEALSAAVRRPRPARRRRSTPLHRDEDGVTLQLRDGRRERFDEVILACHADQALAILADPSRARARDARRVPLPAQRGRPAHRRLAAAAPPRGAAGWNYHLFAQPRPAHDGDLLHEPPPAPRRARGLLRLAEHDATASTRRRSSRTIDYAHPVYTAAGVAAQARWSEISGRAAHALLRRLLGLGLPRGRRRIGAASRRRAVMLRRPVSCVYEGWVRHRRYGEVRHELRTPPVHALPRSRRAARAVRRLPIRVRTRPRARRVPPQRPPRRPGPPAR